MLPLKLTFIVQLKSLGVLISAMRLWAPLLIQQSPYHGYLWPQKWPTLKVKVPWITHNIKDLQVCCSTEAPIKNRLNIQMKNKKKQWNGPRFHCLRTTCCSITLICRSCLDTINSWPKQSGNESYFLFFFNVRCWIRLTVLLSTWPYIYQESPHHRTLDYAYMF